MTNAELTEILEGIRAATADGVLRPKAIVEAARPARHRLHASFIWDDKKAAQVQREGAARELMRRANVPRYRRHIVPPRTVRVPTFVRKPSLDRREAGYTALATVDQESEEARAVLADEFARIVGAARRALGVAGSLGFDDLEKRTSALLAEAEALRGLVTGEEEADLGEGAEADEG
jgi:hypothetical protein